MQFEVRFYFTRNGDRPLDAFLQDLKEDNEVLHKLVVAGIKKIRNRSYHGPPLTTIVDKKRKIYELRVGGTDIARVFFFFRPGQIILLTNGYVKKQQKVDIDELERARRCKRDWEERFP